VQTWIVTALLFALPAAAVCAKDKNPMSAGDVTCPQYLALTDPSEKAALQSWVAGRVAAIIPATFQRELRKISILQFHQDLNDFCAASVVETTLFEASALLAYGYQQEHGQ
jgi:hypothetical protein